jgi:hypothetical protein
VREFNVEVMGVSVPIGRAEVKLVRIAKKRSAVKRSNTFSLIFAGSPHPLTTKYKPVFITTPPNFSSVLHYWSQII